jgi:hypothetical protein
MDDKHAHSFAEMSSREQMVAMASNQRVSAPHGGAVAGFRSEDHLC